MRTQNRSRWSNPLVLAVLAAALAGVSNAVATWMTAQNQLEKEEQSIEKAKAESARLSDMVKYVDPDQVAQNLRFLLDTKLLTDEEQRANIERFLKNRPRGDERVSVPRRKMPGDERLAVIRLDA
jgi:HSP90 family molecular chaperone